MKVVVRKFVDMAQLVLLSPAKTMQELDSEPRAKRQPRFLKEAISIIDALSAKDWATLQALWKTSDALTQENVERLEGLSQRMAQSYLTKTAAAFSYVGIQYQHLSPEVMTEDELEWLDKHLRILSGVYGILAPFDGILPYRLEMQAKTKTILGQTLYDFWAKKIVDTLLAECTDVREPLELINCASVEYSKVVQIGIKALAPEQKERIHWIDIHFYVPKQKEYERKEDIQWVERSTEAKASRGTFVRWMAERGVSTLAELKDFSERDYETRNCSKDVLNFYKKI